MKTYLKNILPQLKNYSQTLDKISILIDKPWALIDEEYELQKLIFQRNKDLILSKNGQVSIGKWDYFPQARSILIDRHTDKILCNEQFIDEGIMILKLDGTDNRFFILANETIVPDLDALRYLKQLRYNKLNIYTRTLSNGKEIEIQSRFGYPSLYIDDYVFFDGERVQDGRYHLSSNDEILLIKESKIAKIYYIKKYKTIEGYDLTVEQQWEDKRSNGDAVYTDDDQPASDGKYKIGLISSIRVKNGVII